VLSENMLAKCNCFSIPWAG